MPKYEILISVTTCEVYHVEADSEEQADAKQAEGEADLIRTEGVESYIVQTDLIDEVK